MAEWSPKSCARDFLCQILSMVVNALATLEFTDRAFQVNHITKTQIDRISIEVHPYTVLISN